MIRYPICLEIGEDGHCMAHVVGLPGCIVRATDRALALDRLPQAIREHLNWLRERGEAIPSEQEEISVEVAEEISGAGPFDPGDAAALFDYDRRPLSVEDMEAYFRLMFHTRVRLLMQAYNVPVEVLDWQPDPSSFSPRRILRHIGNAEKWYVSRISPPESLPPEWEHDEDLNILVSLEMVRRTALAHMRQWSEEERGRIFYPTHSTIHPGEAWTARKVLRRFLEYELEHTNQLRETLDAWCQLAHGDDFTRPPWHLTGLG